MLHETFLHELRELRGQRVTVIWSANYSTACTTGKLVQVGTDFVEVCGLVPTFYDTIGQCCDLDGYELETVILLKHVIAVVEDVPCERKATVPNCCYAADPPASASTDPSIGESESTGGSIATHNPSLSSVKRPLVRR